MLFDQADYTPLITSEKIRIVFLFQAPSFWASWESFYYACLNDERFNVKLVLYNKLTFSQAQMQGAEEFLKALQLEYILFDDFDMEIYKAHVVVIQSPYDLTHRIDDALSWRFRKLGCRVVYIPYGIEITDDGNKDRIAHFHSFVVLNAWRIFVISERMEKLYKEACPNRNAVKVSGHPKFDAYANRAVKKLSPDLENAIAGRKVVLWKMHFPKSDDKGILKTPDVSEYIKFAKNLSKYKDLFFIFMPHPLMLAKNKELTDEQQVMSDNIMSAVSLNDNAYIYLDADYRPALIRADAIIIDRSAIMIEAGITGKPIIYMHSKNNPETIAEAFSPLVESYYKGTNADDMEHFVQQFIQGIDDNKEFRKKMFREVIPYADGKCAKRIADSVITDIISESLPRKLRIAAFGMGITFDEYWMKAVSKKSDIELVAIADNKSFLWGTQHNGVPVIEPVKLRDIDFDAVVIFSEKFYREIYRQLVFDINIDEDKILRLDKFLIEILYERT